jgi:16S rRNA (uracil1498-N3)-methyltransferase
MKEKHRSDAPRSGRSQRLYVEAPLAAGAVVACAPGQANYLLNALRLGAGAPVLVFNGRDGEWLARLETARRGQCSLSVEARTRPQRQGPDVEYLFAPLKHARLDYMAQKAAEMGAAALRPVYTRHTVAGRVNTDRMRANLIEAAEQCGTLWIPQVHEPERLDRVLDGWPASRTLIFCDEAAPAASPVEALSRAARLPAAVLIGPEGGFHDDERARLLALPGVCPISLGPRVLRADTAAVAALALVNAVLGDWRGEGGPHAGHGPAA